MKSDPFFGGKPQNRSETNQQLTGATGMLLEELITTETRSDDTTLERSAVVFEEKEKLESKDKRNFESE